MTLPILSLLQHIKFVCYTCINIIYTPGNMGHWTYIDKIINYVYLILNFGLKIGGCDELDDVGCGLRVIVISTSDSSRLWLVWIMYSMFDIQ